MEGLSFKLKLLVASKQWHQGKGPGVSGDCGPVLTLHDQVRLAENVNHGRYRGRPAPLILLEGDQTLKGAEPRFLNVTKEGPQASASGEECEDYCPQELRV